MLFPTAPLFPLGPLQVAAGDTFVPGPGHYCLFNQQLHRLSARGLLPAETGTGFLVEALAGREWASSAQAWQYLTEQLSQVLAGQDQSLVILPDGELRPVENRNRGVSAREWAAVIGSQALIVPLTDGPLQHWRLVLASEPGNTEHGAGSLPLNPVASALVARVPRQAGQWVRHLYGPVLVVAPGQWEKGAQEGRIPLELVVNY